MDGAPAPPTVRARTGEAEPQSPQMPRLSRRESDVSGFRETMIVFTRSSAHRPDRRRDERHRAGALRKGRAQWPRRGLTDEPTLTLRQSDQAWSAGCRRSTALGVLLLAAEGLGDRRSVPPFSSQAENANRFSLKSLTQAATTSGS